MISGRHSSDHLAPELIAKARSLFDRVSPTGAPIRYHDLAIRWPEYQMQQYFPVTFLDCLSRVTPPNGMLTFERFCAGLRLAIVEEKENQQKTPTPIFGRQQILLSNGNGHGQKSQTPPAPPIRSAESIEKTRVLRNVYGSTQSMTNGQGSPPANSQQPPPYNQALSRSRLNLDQPPHEQKNLANMKLNALLARSTPQLYQGPSQNGGASQNGGGPFQNGGGFHNGGMMSHHGGHFQNGGHLQNGGPSHNGGHVNNGGPSQNSMQLKNGGPSHDGGHFANGGLSHNGNGHLIQGPSQKMPAQNGRTPQLPTNGSRPSSVQSTDSGSLEGIKFQQPSMPGPTVPANGHGVVMRQKNGPKAIGADVRRHTMIEGTENGSKHARLLAEEKDLLKKAADTTHRLYNWYNERISSLETREKLVGKSMIPLDFAVHEEKLNYLRAHITEVNRRAVALMESSDKGFPWHMNLELHRSIPQPADDQLMWMKRQNKMLTNEVAEKSERISQLESEKSRLLKQLCESSSYKPMSHQPQTNPYINGSTPIQHTSPSGTDSGFHSLTHPSGPAPPLPPPNAHMNGHHPQTRQHYPSQTSVVYATPTVNVMRDGHQHEQQIRYREPIPPPPPQHRVHAELHKPPTERQHGILATLM